jgi:hypothetical protein
LALAIAAQCAEPKGKAMLEKYQGILEMMQPDDVAPQPLKPPPY